MSMAAGTEIDYLVIGAGAAGLAFTDALVSESDATVLIVDRRHSPGGHWNDAYPFVRLHQPSAFYGVNSTHLGQDRIDRAGPNAGFYERATAAEVCAYFQAVLSDRLLPTGRVDFVSMSDCVADGGGTARIVCRLTGAVREVTVKRKIVDARYLESSIPSTHTPGFVVEEGVRCIPVNELVRCEEPADGYVVVGAGKTAMDACNWLLDNGVDPGQVCWVKPRESWVIPRASFQPREKVGNFIMTFAASVEAAALATSVPDLFGRLEESGQLKRVDASVEPTMYRAAILSDGELDQLRTIDHVIRAGHIRRIHRDRISLENDEVTVGQRRVYVDCTADGLPRLPPRPIFEPTRVVIQQLRETSPTFNAALIGYLEGTRDDVDEQNALTPTNTYPSKATDWLRTRRQGMVAQGRWNQAPDVTDWIERSRLNIASGLMEHANEPGVAAAMGSFLEHTDRAIENLGALLTTLDGEDVETTHPT